MSFVFTSQFQYLLLFLNILSIIILYSALKFPDLNFWQYDSAVCSSVDSGLWCLSSWWVLWYLIVNSSFFEIICGNSVRSRFELCSSKENLLLFHQVPRRYLRPTIETKSPVCVQIINSCAHLISMNSDPQSTSMWWDISWGDFLLLPPLPRFSSFFYFSSSFFIALGPHQASLQCSQPYQLPLWCGFFLALSL